MLEDLVAAAINDAVRRVECRDAGEDGRPAAGHAGLPPGMQAAVLPRVA